jgi:hypothetical protein
MAHRRSLGFAGFPVESCGFGQLHVVLFRENHMSGRRRERLSRKSGYARDDKKERAVARKGRLLNRGAFQSLIWTGVAELNPGRRPGLACTIERSHRDD